MARLNKIVVLITGDPAANVADVRGDYGEIIQTACGAAWDGPYQPVDARNEALPRLSAADAVIISGSSANIHKHERWMARSEAWLRDAIDVGAPVLGLCFGHQLLASALGGKVESNPRGREIGTKLVTRLGDDPLLLDMGGEFTANQCHSDTVTELPPGTAVLARSQHDEHQCLRFNPRCYGVQFHPEFDGDLIRRFIDARSEAMIEEGLDPAASRREADDTPTAKKVLHNFIRMFNT